MVSNNFSLVTCSDSQISEIEDYELEVEGSPNSSDQATDVEDMQEAYTDKPLADAKWLALYKQERRTDQTENISACFDRQAAAEKYLPRFVDFQVFKLFCCLKQNASGLFWENTTADCASFPLPVQIFRKTVYEEFVL